MQPATRKRIAKPNQRTRENAEPVDHAGKDGQARMANVGVLVKPRLLELPYQGSSAPPDEAERASTDSFERSRAANFEGLGETERARAASSSISADPSGLEVGNVGKCGVFEQG